MNGDENGSVGKESVQNTVGFLSCFLSDKMKMTIRKAGQSLKKQHTNKSHNMTRIGLIILALAHDLNNWTLLCWGESMWPEHLVKIVLSSQWIRHSCSSNGQMLWPSGIWDEHLHVFQWILPDFIECDNLKYLRCGTIYLNKFHQTSHEIWAEFGAADLS